MISGKASSLRKIKIIKTISYRLFASSLGMIVLYFTTGSFKIAASISAAELIYKPIQYYIHERIWMKYERKAILENDN